MNILGVTKSSGSPVYLLKVRKKVVDDLKLIQITCGVLLKKVSYRSTLLARMLLSCKHSFYAVEALILIHKIDKLSED